MTEKKSMLGRMDTAATVPEKVPDASTRDIRGDESQESSS